MAFSAEPRYLSLADVVAIHGFIMERMGDSAPLRDEGALESAITRPRMAAYYDGADLVRQATLLAIGIAQAQAFVDGNKRAAYGAVRAFLRVNGLRFMGEPLELARQVEAVGERTGSLAGATDRFEAWLRERVGPL